MTKELTTRQLKNKFRKLFIEEFEDPNEAFMDFMLDLISKEILEKIIVKGDRAYYSLLHKYL